MTKDHTAYTGDLAQEITKDPYNFDFIALNRDYNEKELKDALTEKVMNLLIEMGKGFAFVGREYPLPIEGTEEYIDLLFYHLNLHCYVVVEVKIKEFKSRDIGQIGTYINIVDDIVKMDSDGKTIGLIICKEKNNVLANSFSIGIHFDNIVNNVYISTYLTNITRFEFFYFDLYYDITM